MMGTQQEIVESSQVKLQRKLELNRLPKVFSASWPDKDRQAFSLIWNRRSKLLGANRSFSITDKVSFLNTPIRELQEEYLQLYHDRVKQRKYKSYLISIFIEFPGNSTIAAAYDWLFIGDLQNGDRFAAVLYVHVRGLFKGCGLSTLLKLKEIELAKENQCDFIQTYHKANNRDFLAAITPSLKTGFALFHGKATGGEYYEDDEEDKVIHLRKYLSRKTRTDVKVSFKDGSSFKSNKENLLILEYLTNCKSNPGKAIVEVEPYGD